MPIRVNVVQECDATKADSSYTDGYKNQKTFGTENNYELLIAN